MAKELSQKAQALADFIAGLPIAGNPEEFRQEIEQEALRIKAIWPDDVVTACYVRGITASIMQGEKFIERLSLRPVDGSNPKDIIPGRGVSGQTAQTSDGAWNRHKR